MKHTAKIILATIIGVFVLMECFCFAADMGQSVDQEAHNKAVVLRYFHEVLDGKRFDRMDALFTKDVVMHRPDGTLSDLAFIQSMFKTGLSAHDLETIIHDVIASEDRVVVRLSHRMTFSSTHAFLRSRVGMRDVRGKTIHWDAMAIFRFENGKIAEEWVSFDELGKLLQIGSLEFSE